ncbi:SdiA-regulated domain-containing protein [Pseudomonas aeruginosa]|nr:SdiA-regulated domain-containing protein [Pseudomonas aeruginosa]
MVAEERRQRLVEIHVDADTRVIDIDDPRNARKFSLGSANKRNKGFEGLAYDPLRERLFVAREKAPVGIIEVNGFFNDRGEALDLSVGGDPQRDRGLFLTDLSSLLLRQGQRSPAGAFRRVAGGHRTGSRRDPLGSLTLRGGNHGLTDDVPQAEGVGDGRPGQPVRGQRAEPVLPLQPSAAGGRLGGKKDGGIQACAPDSAGA